MITVYGIPNCDTIKKTKRWLDAHKLEFRFHSYKKDGVTTALLEEFLQHFSFDELINRRGTTWRKLDDEDKQNLDKGRAMTIMQAQPSIIKRPLIKTQGEWQLGYHEDTLNNLL